jgi:hypothetical protein
MTGEALPATNGAAASRALSTQRQGKNDMTLKRKLQKLALFAAAGIGIGWGAFTLLMVPTDEIPSRR